MNDPQNNTINVTQNRYATFKFAALVVILLATGITLWFLDAHTYLSHARIQAIVNDAGIFGVLVFILIFAASTILILPASALTLIGATIFSPVTAYLAILGGAMLGASISFALGRQLGREFVYKKLARPQKSWTRYLAKMDHFLSEHGLRAMLYLRLGPLPFAIPSYGAALSAISFKDYFLGTFLASLPHILVFVFMGETIRDAMTQGWLVTIQTWQTWVALAAFLAAFMLPWFFRKNITLEPEHDD